MFLKKLEIFGFKSFADKTTLNFGPGITAVVGPNGCGKSNIFDSIRWVLGEQSAKELRGSAMEDVIFNGTDKKTSLGFAEVHLTFDNKAKFFPMDTEEVTISRRLFRSGESEYLVNRTIARLKDVQELLMGTGIGAEAYSLIQQGRVDLVVSAKPEDRRMIFDEAAGITKYKAKKKEALNKLQDTENNLLRLNDITIEVKRQISSIERQANKARKYKEEFEKLKDFEVKLARFLIAQYDKQKNNNDNELFKLKERELILLKEAEEIGEILTNQINYTNEIEQKINEVRSEDIKLNGQIELNNRQIEFNQERIANVIESVQKIDEQKKQLIEKCEVELRKIAELEAELTAIESSFTRKESLLAEKRESLIEIEKFMRSTKEQIKEHEENIIILSSKQANQRNVLTDIVKEVQGALARKRRLEIENDKVLCEKQEVEEKLRGMDERLNSLNLQIGELAVTKNNTDQVISDIQLELSGVDNKINELEKKKVFFISQKEFIEKLNTQYQDIPDPVIEGRLLTDNMPADKHTGIIGKIKEIVALNPDQLNYAQQILSKPNVGNIYEIICEAKFIELDPQQISNKIDEVYQEIEKLAQAKLNLSVKIQEQREMYQRIENEIAEKEKENSVYQAQHKDVESELKKLDGELELLSFELTEVKDLLTSLRQKEEQAQVLLNEVSSKIEWCQNDIKDKRLAITNKGNEKEETLVMITQLETEIAAEKDKLASQRNNIEMFKESLKVWQQEIGLIDEEVSGLKVKKEQFEQEMEAIEVKIIEIEKSKNSLAGIISNFEQERDEIGIKINSLKESINSYEDETENIKQEIHKQELAKQERAFGVQSIKDRLQQSYKIDIDNMYPQIKSEGEEVTVETSAIDIIEKHIPKVALIEDLRIEKEEPTINPDEVKSEIERLKKRCDSYGSVNLVAIDEFEDLKQRFEFLTKQQSDLFEAKSQLMQTINKINRSTRQMFMDTFTKVSEEFRIYFRMLFGGGEAKLILLDPENVLESGIDIIARPPGKKLQNISLLSGGEKTLTAIALIFGVFKVNPSPFCVLDEIDAALDESNVGRFSYLLQDFAKIAQFIVITHNKKTIASSDVMYGITMPETGVSRIVSVKLTNDNEAIKKEEIPVGV